MSATGRQAGFTLIEMLVTLGVAGLIAGLGWPRLQTQIGAQQWRSGVAATAALLRQARARAIRSGQPAVVTVTPGGTSIRLDGGAPLALAGDVRASGDPLRFYADGSATAGVVTVYRGRQRARLTVAPATGLILATTS